MPPEYASLDSTLGPTTLLLKGSPGSGKTTKAAYFPRPVFFNFDNNLAGLRKLPEVIRKGIRIKHPRLDDSGKALPSEKVWDNFIKQLAEVGDDKSVGTIIVDSLTTLAENLQDKILKSSNPGVRMEIQHWGDFTRYLKWLGEEMLCANDLDKHIVIIAHEQIEKEELTQKVTYSLNLQTNMRYSFDLFFTDCWRTYTKPVTGGGVAYWIRTLPTDYHNAKCALNLPPDFEWDKMKDNIVNQLETNLVKK